VDFLISFLVEFRAWTARRPKVAFRPRCSMPLCLCVLPRKKRRTASMDNGAAARPAPRLITLRISLAVFWLPFMRRTLSISTGERCGAIVVTGVGEGKNEIRECTMFVDKLQMTSARNDGTCKRLSDTWVQMRARQCGKGLRDTTWQTWKSSVYCVK